MPKKRIKKLPVVKNSTSPHTAMQRLALACLCIFVATLTACNRGSEDVHFARFEHLLFETEPAHLHDAMLHARDTFESDLLVFFPDDDDYLAMTLDFVSDPVMRDIYRTTDSLYHDFSDIESALGRALHRAYRLCPRMQHVERFFTMVTGDFDNYNYRVFGNASQLCIALDMYALGRLGRYQYFGMPTYIVRTLSADHIVADCMRQIARYNMPPEASSPTLLDYAIEAGKTLYFVEQTVSDINDTILLRYTPAQLQWMKHNTASVWARIVENKMLYSTDWTALRGLVGDAPYTNAFGNASAPRTTDYIGLQIVKQYVKRSGCSMEELLAETDSRKILDQSGWRP